MQTTDFVATVFDGSSNPKKVTITFTIAVNALLKGHTSSIILMMDAVELGRPGATAGMDIGAPFGSVSELLVQYLEEGGRILVCKSCMIHKGLTAEHMDSRFEIISAPDVVELLMNAQGSLQVS